MYYKILLLIVLVALTSAVEVANHAHTDTTVSVNGDIQCSSNEEQINQVVVESPAAEVTGNDDSITMKGCMSCLLVAFRTQYYITKGLSVSDVYSQIMVDCEKNGEISSTCMSIANKDLQTFYSNISGDVTPINLWNNVGTASTSLSTYLIYGRA
ncbi:hypothetical protein SAMD00019534_058160 [Acytostelium subglobosum LB1]|uniref:hypothetical protein n=1 Tax=Acytostelium subglobosum LB1 TaxID=1410327 RepID=UPI0006451C6F|nr:hypothetical protein SAMD00019534_058160 [Acytostelium subglobosum LB1]GAM22641.1 hypothetical protein SAMD00019534_058160 [Acytostelium subglobosum LB1]|eukprot:XP_012754761.1 hypothetical protein SAMD00019534_058160 [Acytostelium subglobosum LB1]